MKVLGLCSYPIESAATRYRLLQFVEPLAARGIELSVRPFLDSRAFARFYAAGSLPQKAGNILPAVMRRFGDAFAARRYDAVIVQREAMMFGPPVFEWLAASVGKRPLILDLDDATYIRYVSPTYGRAGSFLKFFGKTDYLIKKSAAVVCGNRFIAEYAAGLGAATAVVPTVVDTDKFHPVEIERETPVVGWVGTHSTFPFLEKILPALETLAETHRFKLKIVGAGRREINATNFEIENLEWNLARETADFQSFDIGLYPMSESESANQAWLAGKSGFKAIQYLAVGIPYVVTPLGVCAEIGRAGETHFAAGEPSEWIEKLSLLLADKTRRREMGRAGRDYALKHFTVAEQADKLAAVLSSAVEKHR